MNTLRHKGVKTQQTKFSLEVYKIRLLINFQHSVQSQKGTKERVHWH